MKMKVNEIKDEDIIGIKFSNNQKVAITGKSKKYIGLSLDEYLDHKPTMERIKWSKPTKQEYVKHCFEAEMINEAKFFADEELLIKWLKNE